MQNKYNQNYLKNFLIAYIGNKRNLLPLIEKAIESLEINKKNPVFIDYFAGTGVVSRLAKSAGFKVIANDWEYYSYLINKTFIELSEKDINRLFKDEGGLQKILDTLNNLVKLSKKDAYISKYYCPESDKKPDVENERMFYTKENGLIIDRIRAWIDNKYIKNNPENKLKNEILVSILLYYASKHSNTSGVFKGFHKGFGGKNGDALKRILGKIILERPKFSTNTQKCKVFKQDALKLAKKIKKLKSDVVYLDPPYNQHQYGSNYHLLNTIALNDKPEVNKQFMIDGQKINKSAIRKDWIQTRSPYCYKNTALKNFSELIENINTRYLLISYSTEGIIDFDNMLSILKKKGKIGIVTTGYTRFRGGRQAITTKTKNVEFIIIVDTAAKSTEKDLININKILLNSHLDNISELSFPLTKLSNSIITMIKKESIQFKINETGTIFELDNKLHITEQSLEKIYNLPYSEQIKIYTSLSKFINCTNDQEISYLIDALKLDLSFINTDQIIKKITILHKKINYKKNPEKFINTATLISSFIGSKYLTEKNNNILFNLLDSQFKYYKNYINLTNKKDYLTLKSNIESHNKTKAA